MDKMRNMLDTMMEGQSSGSPLTALGLSHLDGPDLLQEKLEGRSAPDTLPTKDERKPQDTPRSSDFSHAYRESLKERELEAEEKPAATEREEAPEVPKEKEYEGFHVLNDELQATRQQIERMSQAQQQREREMPFLVVVIVVHETVLVDAHVFLWYVGNYLST
jgi:broad specificity phosphatase PhoE